DHPLASRKQVRAPTWMLGIRIWLAIEPGLEREARCAQRGNDGLRWVKHEVQRGRAAKQLVDMHGLGAGVKCDEREATRREHAMKFAKWRDQLVGAQVHDRVEPDDAADRRRSVGQ